MLIIEKIPLGSGKNINFLYNGNYISMYVLFWSNNISVSVYFNDSIIANSDSKYDKIIEKIIEVKQINGILEVARIRNKLVITVMNNRFSEISNINRVNYYEITMKILEFIHWYYNKNFHDLILLSKISMI